MESIQSGLSCMSAKSGGAGNSLMWQCGTVMRRVAILCLLLLIALPAWAAPRFSSGAVASGTSISVTLPASMGNQDYVFCQIDRASATGAITSPSGYVDDLVAAPTIYGGTSSAEDFDHRWLTGDPTTVS